MSCSACSSGGCSTGGCNSKSACSSGRCNRLNTYDWLSDLALPDYMTAQQQIIEVSFKNGARKEFFFKPNFIHAEKGDHVVVESAAGGYDIGLISLTGELVRLQMKKKGVPDNAQFLPVLRVANERDMERLLEARDAERETMVQARVIARDLNLQMKIGDVEYQGDKRKVTFYYTADGRVDFRELIRVYAREFKVKIEMRQIGARQESARIGGIGACGRELCCSTWLTEFKSVSTVAARYQNLAINQSKLSGQCGRLKCCLNYELSCYLDALKDFPSNIHHLDTQRGVAKLIKTDIFKRLMFFIYQGTGDIESISVDRVKEIHGMNQKGIKPEELQSAKTKQETERKKPQEIGFVDGTGMIELEELRKGDRNKKPRNKRRPEREARPENAEGTLPVEHTETSENTEREARPERGERRERPARNDRQNRPERGERKERGERSERKERPQQQPIENQSVEKVEGVETPKTEQTNNEQLNNNNRSRNNNRRRNNNNNRNQGGNNGQNNGGNNGNNGNNNQAPQNNRQQPPQGEGNPNPDQQPRNQQPKKQQNRQHPPKNAPHRHGKPPRKPPTAE